jgi:hypothetical protein
MPMAIRTRQTSTEWAANLEVPVTAAVATAKLQEALDYSSDAINEVMSRLGGTIPLSRDLMPELYSAREKVENAHDAIKALADRSPNVEVNPTHVATGKRLGMDLIDASNEAMDKAKQSDSPAKVLSEVARPIEHVAEKAGEGLVSIAKRALTPMEIAFGLFLVDEIFNGGKVRKRLLKG